MKIKSEDKRIYMRTEDTNLTCETIKKKWGRGKVSRMMRSIKTDKMLDRMLDSGMLPESTLN